MTARDRDFLFYPEDMPESMRRIEKYTADFSYEEFRESDLRIDAVIRNPEIIGEASNSIPEEITCKYPELPWKKMYGLRNLIAHEYFGIDYENILKIISDELPNNIQDLESAIEEEKKSESSDDPEE